MNATKITAGMMKKQTEAQQIKSSIKFYKEQIKFHKKYNDSKRATLMINQAQRSIDILTSDRPETFITTAQKRTLGQIFKTAKGFYSYSGKLVSLTDIVIKVSESGTVSISLNTNESTNGLLNKHIFGIIGKAGGLSPKGGRFFEVSSILQDKKGRKTSTWLFLHEMKSRQTKADRLASEAWCKRSLARAEARHTRTSTEGVSK